MKSFNHTSATQARVNKAEAAKVAASAKRADRAAKREAKKAAARKRGKQSKDEDAQVSYRGEAQRRVIASCLTTT